MPIISLGKFTPIGMRTKVTEKNALIINTCSGNDTVFEGDATSWTWCNPTNRVITHNYEDINAVSVEALWQGTKLLRENTRPDQEILSGNWRKNKGKKPAGAYAGPGRPLITTPGEARRRIYVPAYKRLFAYWMNYPTVHRWLREARDHDGPVFLRDFDVGRGLDRNGPLSHAWLVAMFLNNGVWPD